MSETSSKRRKKGREAFAPYCDPMNFQPYKLGTWAYENYLSDWLEGWKEAEVAYKEEVPCQWCGEMTENNISEECTECSELYWHIEQNVEMAETMINRIKNIDF